MTGPQVPQVGMPPLTEPMTAVGAWQALQLVRHSNQSDERAAMSQLRDVISADTRAFEERQTNAARETRDRMRSVMTAFQDEVLVAARELSEAVKAGQMDPVDAVKALRRLEGRARKLMSTVEVLPRAVARHEKALSDPVAALDALQSRWPTLRKTYFSIRR